MQYRLIYLFTAILEFVEIELDQQHLSVEDLLCSSTIYIHTHVFDTMCLTITQL